MKKITLHAILKILYSSFYILLGLCLVGLLVISPADGIRQSLRRDQLAFLFVIGGCYCATAVVALFLYSNRIYSKRKAIAEIPKSYIPIEKGDVNKKVRRMIVASLSRSAAIAWDSRPRIPTEPPTIVSEPGNRDAIARPAEGESEKIEGSSGTAGLQEGTVTIPPTRPVWGDIAHNGWSTPTSPDLPNLQYITVILELPHLIEARAVSLAPPDPESASEPPLPDIRAVDLLQRPAAMGLRDYIGHLTSVGVISSSIATDFLASYEYARFSARPLSETQFRDLMKQFAEVLRSMNPLTPAILASLDIDPPESDIDDDEVSSTSTPTTARSRSLASRSAASRDSSEGTIRTAPSQNPGPNGSPKKKRERFSTAPATPKSKKRVISRTPSANSFAQSRQPYNGSSGDSSENLRSASQSSVIRLSKTNEDGELPYVLKIPRAR
jgi:hypothetical protein